MSQPSHFGRYAVTKKVGSGGFATVWLARDEELDAEVAIKVLAEHWVDDHDVRRRFVEEGRFLRKVESPHVVGVHDIGTTADDRPFLVLTYADRGTLAERIKEGPLDLTDTVDVIEHVGAGLQELHDRGVLHRDVKPANVLFRTTPTGERAMLGDLGLGKSLDAVSRVTMPGGTPAYVAPEQVRGDTLDPRADLYALAAVTYAALAGKPPYGATTLAAVLVVEGPPDSLRTVRDDIPAEVDEVILRALRQDREERWPDVRSYADALKEAALATVVAASVPAAGALAGPPAEAEQAPDSSTKPVPLAAPAEPEARDSKPSARPWIVAVVLAALLGAAGGYAGWQYGLTRQWVGATDSTGKLSVELPRGWADDFGNDGWQPSGASGRLPALLVSEKNADWGTSGSTVSGVFAGVLPSTKLPPSLSAPAGCKTTASGQSGNSVSAEYADCPNGITIYERVVLVEGRTIRLQVRSSDKDQAIRVLDSVRYQPN